MERRLSRLAVMDFRFLAPLGMTGRRGWIVAATPFCLPLSARRGRDTERGSLQCNSPRLNSYGNAMNFTITRKIHQNASECIKFSGNHRFDEPSPLPSAPVRSVMPLSVPRPHSPVGPGLNNLPHYRCWAWRRRLFEHTKRTRYVHLPKLAHGERRCQRDHGDPRGQDGGQLWHVYRENHPQVGVARGDEVTYDPEQ